MSDRIIIDIAVDEFEFVKEAIAFKARSLISYLDTCKEHHESNDEDDELPDGFVLTELQVNAMKKAGLWDNLEKRYEAIKKFAQLEKINKQFDEEYKKRKDAFVKKTPVRRGRPPAKKTSKK